MEWETCGCWACVHRRKRHARLVVAMLFAGALVAAGAGYLFLLPVSR